jgi:ArsR family transcriptional regulator
MLSPKAVIDHLQMMEREAILSCQMDDRRRKYYYLENDILIDINLKQVRVLTEVIDDDDTRNDQLKNSVTLLGRMIKAHDMILSNLEQVNHDIETKMNDLARNHKDLFRSDREITVIIALSHDSLTFQELELVTEVSQKDLGEILKRFERKGLIGRIKERYTLRGVYAE